MAWLLVAAAAATTAGPLADRDAQRARYRAALADVAAGRNAGFDAAAAALADYPLLSYLHFARLRRDPGALTPAQLAAFRSAFPDSPLPARLERAHLLALAAERRWPDLRAHAAALEVAASDAELRCHVLHARMAGGDPGAPDEARELWRVGRSQPAACDPVFKAARAAGSIDDDLMIERIHLAWSGGQRSLARYLQQQATGRARDLAQWYGTADQNPQAVLRAPRRHGDTALTRHIVAHALHRLAERDPNAALAAWLDIGAALAFDATERSRIGNGIAGALARSGQPVPPGTLTTDHAPSAIAAGEVLALAAIRDARWQDLLASLNAMPAAGREQPRWQYWAGRARLALAAPPRPDEPLPRLAGGPPALPVDAPPVVATMAVDPGWSGLAGQRHYYGYLAAWHLGRPPKAGAPPPAWPPAELARVRAALPVARALELRALGADLDARREWVHALAVLPGSDRQIAAWIADAGGWHPMAIHAALATDLADQLTLRFPRAYQPAIEANARRTGLAPEWLWAITRIESAFNADARSPAGAVGLMQLLPSTAQSVARAGRIEFRPARLTDPDTNITLGASYLAQMMHRHGGHRVLAAAAYNAGPGRVRQWLAARKPAPIDAWIEAIPFAETRNYVQNTLVYAQIYAALQRGCITGDEPGCARLPDEAPFLYDHER